MEISADRDRCVGAGHCVMTIPDVFAQDDNGLVVVTRARTPEPWDEQLVEVAQLCPSQSITVAEGSNSQVEA